MPNFGENPNFAQLALQGLQEGLQRKQQATQFAATQALAHAQLQELRERNRAMIEGEQRRIDIAERGQAFQEKQYEEAAPIRDITRRTGEAQLQGLEFENAQREVLQGLIESDYQLPIGVGVQEALLIPGLLQGEYGLQGARISAATSRENLERRMEFERELFERGQPTIAEKAYKNALDALNAAANYQRSLGDQYGFGDNATLERLTQLQEEIAKLQRQKTPKTPIINTNRAPQIAPPPYTSRTPGLYGLR